MAICVSTTDITRTMLTEVDKVQYLQYIVYDKNFEGKALRFSPKIVNAFH